LVAFGLWAEELAENEGAGGGDGGEGREGECGDCESGAGERFGEEDGGGDEAAGVSG
jgi:hypothetical protein